MQSMANKWLFKFTGTREEVGSKKSGMVAEFSDLVLHFDAFACVGEQDLNEPQVLRWAELTNPTTTPLKNF